MDQEIIHIRDYTDRIAWDHDNRMEVLYHLYPVQLFVYANYLLLLPRDGESDVGGLGFAV